MTREQAQNKRWMTYYRYGLRNNMDAAEASEFANRSERALLRLRQK